MNWVAKAFVFGRNNGSAMQVRLEQALQSLNARSLIETYELQESSARIHGGRGNFGTQLELHQDRAGWLLAATPIANPAGPFATGVPSGEICPLALWIACGKGVELPRVDRTAHPELVEWLRELESRHPAVEWMAQQFKRLAKGERLSNDDLQGVVLLGIRRFVKTISSSDRLHETIEPALVTLLRMNSASGGREENMFESENYASALISFLQETHPLEAKRAAQKYMMSR